jgi:hypothetical protein
VSFLNPELREICSAKEVMEMELGGQCARLLKPLLFDFDAADYITDIFPIRNPKISTFESEPALIFPLINNIVLIGVNVSNRMQNKASSSVNWSKVYRLKIVYIGKYND